MPGTTPRRGLPYSLGADLAATIDDTEHSLALALDNDAEFRQGTLALRGSAGTYGRFYNATDDTTGGPSGTLYFDNGTAWIQVNLVADAAVTTAKLADAAATSRKAKLTAGTIRSTGTISPLTSTRQDVPGVSLSITPDVASVLLIWGTFEGHLRAPDSSSTAQLQGWLTVDGADQTGVAYAKFAPVTDTGYVNLKVGESWMVPLTAAPHTVKLRCATGGNFGTGLSDLNNASMSYLLLAS